MSTRDSGAQAERFAETWLKARGLQLLQRNFRCPLGEIDLIMRDGSSIVFVEVRHRMRSDHVSPLESVTPAKCRKLTRTAQIYLQKHHGDAQPQCRIDVVAIDGPLTTDSIHWIQGAI